MKYIHIHDKRTGIDYPWMADIQSLPDLMEIEETFCSKNAKDIMEFLQSKDYDSVLNQTFSGGKRIWGDHCHPQNKLAPFLWATVLSFPEKEKFYPIVYFVEKLSKANKGKVEMLAKYGRILINNNGGYMMWCDTFEEIESTISNRFPQYKIGDVKVSKWPEGKHFYATVDGKSIYVDGEQKWNSEESAMKAVKKWLGCKNKE